MGGRKGMEEGRMGMEDGAGGEGWMMGRDECEGYGRGGGRSEGGGWEVDG